MNPRPSGKWYFWILLALLIKGLMFFALTGELGKVGDEFIGIAGGNVDGDANSYIMPVEFLISDGKYDPDFRMPGYAFAYYPFRLFLNLSEAQNALVLIQYLFSAISVYVLGLIALGLFQSKRMFYLVYFSFLLATYTQIFDLYILTESLTVSFSVFALYYLMKGIKDKSKLNLFISGIWITWIIFLRPVYAPYLILFSGIIFWVLLRDTGNIIRPLKYILIFLIPFAIVDGIWMYKNYKKYSTIQPLTKSIYYPDAVGSYYIKLVEFLQSWGGSYIFWDSSAEIRLLGITNSTLKVPIVTKDNVKIPDYIYTNEFNSDSLQLIKTYVIAMQEKSVSFDSVEIVNSLLIEKLNRYTESVKTEHPFVYHVTARLRYFKSFLLHSGTYNLMQQPWVNLNIIKKGIKVIYSAQYLFILFAGLIGSMMLFIRRFGTLEMVLPCLTIYSIVIFPWVLRLPELRYFVPSFPFLLICAMYVTNEVIRRLNSHRIINKK